MKPEMRSEHAMPPGRLPKVCGLDAELANFVSGSLASTEGTCREASHALIREIEGLPAQPDALAEAAGDENHSPRDFNRRYLPQNGGCAYIDLNHLELAIPEVLSAHDHVAAWHGMLRVARRALHQANLKRPPDRRIHVLVNNSDGFGHSYGSHLNVLVTRRAFDNIFHRKIQYMLSLAAYQVSSIVFTGQGKVGSENGTPFVPYQISQRADFFERLCGHATTVRRPIVNARDEAHCGGRGSVRFLVNDREEGARLHVIFYDSNLAHAASLLKVGVLQIVLAMIEAESISGRWILEDPLDALLIWSHDCLLGEKARLCSGKKFTAVELQLLILEEARRFFDRGGCDGVPGASSILSLWEDTLLKLKASNLDALAARLDWVLKLKLIERAMGRKKIDWMDPEVKRLDLAYSDLDLETGLYWACELGGAIERHVSEADIERFVHEPPAGTRAWTRAMLLRRAGPNHVHEVDWDFMIFKSETLDPWYPTEKRALLMPDPTGLTREETKAMLLREGTTLEEILDELGAVSWREPSSRPQWKGEAAYGNA
jgi:proteasome accessory factor A